MTARRGLLIAVVVALATVAFPAVVNAGSSSGSPATVSFNVRGPGAAAIHADNHDIGNCGRDFFISRTCQSGNGFPIGTKDGSTIVHARAPSGWKFDHWVHDGVCIGFTGADDACRIYAPPGDGTELDAVFKPIIASLALVDTGLPAAEIHSINHDIGNCGRSFLIPKSGDSPTRCLSGPGLPIGSRDLKTVMYPTIPNGWKFTGWAGSCYAGAPPIVDGVATGCIIYVAPGSSGIAVANFAKR
jgi:hypothetical protein